MNMSRNKVVEWDVVEKGLRVLDYELPESQEEAVNEDRDKNGDGIKEIRKWLTRIEERLMILETRYEKVLDRLIGEIELKQGVRLAELERKVRAIRGMLKEYFKEEVKEHEQK